MQSSRCFRIQERAHHYFSLGAIPPILPQSMKDTLNGHAMPLEQLKRSTGGQHKSINATTPVSTTFQRRSPLPTLEAHVPVEGTVGSAGYVPPPRSTPGQAPARQVPLPQSFTSASGKRAANAKRGKTVGATRERREEAGIGRPQFLPWDDSEDAALLSYIHANILENATATLEPPRKLPRRDAYGRMIDWTVIERAMHAQEVLGGKKRSAAAYATRGKILLAGEELKLEQESVGTSSELSPFSTRHVGIARPFLPFLLPRFPLLPYLPCLASSFLVHNILRFPPLLSSDIELHFSQSIERN